MAKARWTIPINMRLEDKPVLDAALNIAKEEGTNITKIFRTALVEFVRRKSQGREVRKMDEFLDDSKESVPSCNEILTPVQLKVWSDADLLNMVRRVRSRKFELDHEIRRRGFFFDW